MGKTPADKLVAKIEINHTLFGSVTGTSDKTWKDHQAKPVTTAEAGSTKQ